MNFIEQINLIGVKAFQFYSIVIVHNSAVRTCYLRSYSSSYF